MNRKSVTLFIVFLAVSSCLLLPAWAVSPDKDKTLIPIVSLLLAGSKDNIVTPCASRGEGEVETVMNQGQEWQRCDNQQTYHWSEAVNYCQNMVLNEFSDWRLPTKDELKGIVFCSNGTQTPLPDLIDTPKWKPYLATCLGENQDDTYRKPTISEEFVCVIQKYWASTTEIIGDKTHAWTVDFEDGDAATREINKIKRLVRCVRPK